MTSLVLASGVPSLGARVPALSFEITPTIAGLTVGALVGVVGFIAVLLVTGRGRARTHRTSPPPDRVVVPRYATFPHAAFVPSTALSARAFAKMGYAWPRVSSASSDDAVQLSEEDLIDATPAPTRNEAGPVLPPVTIAPVIVLSQEAPKSSPHPLGVIKSTSDAMRGGASMKDLAFDDSPTEIGETFFDEPAKLHRRSDPPKIRRVTPEPPRFPARTHPLPRVTTPPPRFAGARS